MTGENRRGDITEADFHPPGRPPMLEGTYVMRLAPNKTMEGTVPLSDHEQRLLEQMERALSAEDPKFVTAMRGADLRRRYQRRALLASLTFIVGIVMLMTGAMTSVIALGVAGFVVMLISAWFAITSWRRVPAEGDIGEFPPAKSAGRQASRGDRRRFMERLEERWRKRREEGPGGRGR